MPSDKPWEYDPEQLVVLGADDRVVCDLGFYMHPDRPVDTEMQRVHALGCLIARAPDLERQNAELLGAVRDFREYLKAGLENEGELARRSAFCGTDPGGGLETAELDLEAFNALFHPILARANISGLAGGGSDE